jgi:hypothetical protein
MSNSRYEREIEEILRKIDDDRPPNVSDRLRTMGRRPPRRQVQRSTPGTEFWLIAGVVVAFGAETARWILQPADGGLEDFITGIVVLAAFAMIVVALLLRWIGGQPTGASWRGTPLDSTRQGGARGPFVELRRRMALFRMKLSYRRRQRE